MRVTLKVLAVTGMGATEWTFVEKGLSLLLMRSGIVLESDQTKRYRPLAPLVDKRGEQQDARDTRDTTSLFSPTTFFGATGRFLIAQVDPPSKLNDKELRVKLKEAKDTLYEQLEKSGMSASVGLHQPFHFHLQTSDDVNRQDVMKSVIRKGRSLELFRDYFQVDPLLLESCSNDERDRKFLPSKRWMLNQHIRDRAAPRDQAETERKTQIRQGVGALEFPDWSHVAVFDDLIDDGLRSRLLRVILGPNADNWDDVANGPDPKRWTKGGTTDYPGQPKTDDWGLAGEATVDVIMGNHPAIRETESLIAELFKDYYVARLPLEDFLVTPINVNAPTRGNHFNLHFDSNPLMTTSSGACMFHEIYGKYNNRVPGKPLFLSFLVYLVNEWKDEWGAPTSFVKFSDRMATAERHKIKPRPGRVVVMDSDVWHSVNAPNDAAGERARYSMVWRLILYPKEENQNMRDWSCGRPWQEPDVKIMT